MDVDTIRAVANAVLYEGYMLYPYRPSALKNRSGWSFGTLLPRSYVANNPGESDFMQSEVLLLASEDSVLNVEARFLQLGHGASETLERTVQAKYRVHEINAPVEATFEFGRHAAGVRSVRGVLEVQAHQIENLVKLTIGLHNGTELDETAVNRDQALTGALIAAHVLITLDDGRFISLLDPPDEFSQAISGCKQVGVFPVMVGDAEQQNAMLLSPIILYDYPKIASESKGEFFDSTEIDEMLTLRVLTLSDAEKNEIRAAGGQACRILERTEALSNTDVSRLHGILQAVPPEKTR
jgi:hypothetical protein